MKTDNFMDNKAIIGVDLGGTNLRVGRVEQDRLSEVYQCPISSQAPEPVVCAEVVSAIRRVFNQDTVGIGVGVPSVVDPERGIVYSVENIPSWQAVPLKDILEREFKVPVSINNDANTFALGEYYYGCGKGFETMVGITIGTGLGAGLIIQGRLYNGTNCGAGEIGYIPYKDHTVEYYCSGPRFNREWGFSGGELFLRAQQGDAVAHRWFHEFGLDFGDAITIALLAYDPELIVVGGSVSLSFQFYESGIHEKLKLFPYPQSLQKLKIVPTQDTRMPILGAAALHLDLCKKANQTGGIK